MTRFFSAIFFLLFTLQGGAQDYKRTFNWYFGSGAGLNFNTTPPSALNGSLWTDEGCASISDTNGNLLFYTNGVTIYNKTHQVMQNGNDLLGHPSSTQSSLIVPYPNNDSLFYVITCDIPWRGLRANLINMKAQNGLGEVIVKNQLLQQSMCEKLTATKHQNGRDVWILAHGFTNNYFYAYLITDKGLVGCPVITAIGEVIGRDYGYGILVGDAQTGMKFSMDGKKLANCVHNVVNPSIELFDFNSATGELSNLKHISFHTDVNTADVAYGVEFSPNKRYLYFTQRLNFVCRFDLSLINADSIQAHQDTLYVPPVIELTSRHKGLQLTPDKRIFIALVDSTYISSIEYPDSVSCNFSLNGLSLNNKGSKYGLPNFITSYFNDPVVDFSYKKDCRSDTIKFYGKDTLNRSNWSWRFKKLSDNTTLNSSQQNPVLVFTDTGHYEAQLIVGTDTVVKTIHIDPPMKVDFNLGNDTTLCDGDSIILDAGSGYYCYVWQDSVFSSIYSAKQTGKYIVTVTDKDFCQVQDSIVVTFSKIIKPNLTRIGDTIFATSGNYGYQWYKDNSSINSDTLYYTIRSSDGSYKVKVTNTLGCSIFSETYNTTGENTINSQSIRIYPNPSKGDVTIESSLPDYNVTLTDIRGKVLFQTKGSHHTIVSLDQLPIGVYFLRIHNDSSSFNVKLMVQR